MNDLVSVIIPAYNHEKFIDDTFDSLLRQTYKNLDIIILNDGSKDQTGSLIEQKLPILEKNFSYVTYIDKENEGVIKTLNKGIKKAKGTFIFYFFR